MTKVSGPVLYCGQALRQLPQLPVLQASRIRASPLDDIFLQLFSVKVVVKSFLHGSKEDDRQQEEGTCKVRNSSNASARRWSQLVHAR